MRHPGTDYEQKGPCIMAHNITMNAGSAVAERETSATENLSLLDRISQVFYTNRQRRTERAVERYIQSHGGEMTDNMEREISRRFGNMVD